MRQGCYEMCDKHLDRIEFLSTEHQTHMLDGLVWAWRYRIGHGSAADLNNEHEAWCGQGRTDVIGDNGRCFGVLGFWRCR